MPLDPANVHAPRARNGSRSRSGLAVCAALGVGALTYACKIDPERPVLKYSLADSTTRLGDDGLPVIPEKVQAHIEGSLAMLFGTAANPQYMLLGEWVDDGYDPNYPTYPEDDMGSGELAGDEALERIAEANRSRFHRQLALIEEQRYEEVDLPEHMLDLGSYWNDELLPAWQARGEEGSELDADEFQEQATSALLDWYPTLRESAELYRVQCAHCHGPEGGGNGPTAEFLNPLPRDYRMGVFKFTSQKDKATPSRRDLFEILARGVTGTAMPSFRRFSDAELHGLVDYVRLLSMRGMVERDLAVTYEFDGALPAEYVLESYQAVFDKWGHGEDSVVWFDGEVPHPTEDSIARGKALFEDAATGNCFSCHGMTGRGDGPAVYVTDPETGLPVVDKKDDWGHDIMPRNFHQGIFRGGRRPIDIYRRVYAGINGTPMPALGESKDADGNPLLTAEDLWSIVHYVGWLAEQGPEAGAHRGAEGHAGAHGAHGAGGHGDAGAHGDQGNAHDEETH